MTNANATAELPTVYTEYDPKWGNVANIDEILRRTSYPEQAYRSCVGVLSFAKKYTAERLENACERALH